MYQRVAAHLAQEPIPLFAILDGARDRSISRRLRASDLRYQSLYEGEAGEELAPFGPYLVALPRDAQFLEPWLQEAWGKSHGVYFTSGEAFASVRRHLRRFLMVQLEDGRNVYFRFYDPRVLRLFLPECTYEEWISFFGSIDSYLIESDNGKCILRFRREADTPTPEQVELVN